MAPIVLLILIGAGIALWYSLGPAAASRSAKRCSRCWRPAQRLQPYIDGRREFWVCPMCAAEMDFTNATHVDVPSK